MGLRLLAALHGYLGVLTVAALLHPAILLRKGVMLSFRLRLAVGLSAAFAVLALGSGLLLYGDYRRSVRPELFQASYRAGLLFETKEHLAVVAVALSIGAALAAFVAPRDAPGLRRAAAAFFAVAAVLVLATAAMGTYVAAVRGFA